MNSTLPPEVRICRVWKSASDELLGYTAAIFGRDGWKRSYAWNTNLCNAFDGVDHFQDTSRGLWSTPEGAQAAWESATPVPLPGPVAGRLAIPADTVTAINELKLYRSLPDAQDNP